MKQFILLTLCIFTFGFSNAQLDTLSIDSAQWVSAADLANCKDLSRYDGKKVVVHGICLVDGDAYGSSSHNIHITMSSTPLPFGSLRLRASSSAQYSVSIQNLKAGDSIRVVGTINTFRDYGDTQLDPDETNDAITIFKRNIPVSDTVLSVGTFNNTSRINNPSTGEQWEGAFVTIKDVEVKSVDPFSGNTRVSFVVADKAGNQINISDHFTVQKLPAYTHPVTNQPGTFSPPSEGDVFKSISGIILHSSNCAPATGRGYELAPFKASHYVYGPSAPRITNVKRDFLTPTSSQAVKVSADIKDLDGQITSATLFYNTGTNVNDLNFTSVTMTKGTGDNYSASIPAQSNGTFVRYYISAEDDSSNVNIVPSSNPKTKSYAYRVRDNGLTIYDLQFTPFSDGESIFLGREVTVPGVVTATGKETGLPLIHIQDENAITGWSGIELQSAGTTFDRDDKLTVTGVVNESFGKTVLSVTNVTKSGKGSIDPLYILPDSVTNYSFEGTERYESVLVGFINPSGKLHVVDTNADAPSSFAEWKIGRDKNDPSSGARVLTGRENFSSTAVSFVNSSFNVKNPYPTEKIVITDTVNMDTLIGIMTYSFGNMKLLPRDNDDFKGINIIPSSLESYTHEMSFRVYPNPSEGIVTIELSENNEHTIQISSISGKIITQTTATGTSNTIDVSEFNNGVYVISISDKNQRVLAREKLVVKH